MKIITPPQITDLDELLDVVLHPEKFEERLLALREMRDGILAALEVYATKERADAYFEAAEARLVEANGTLARALEEKEVQEEDATVTKTRLAEDRQACETQRQAESQALVMQRSELERAIAEREEQRRQLSQRESEVEAMRVSLLQQKESVNREMSKIESAKKVLDTLN